jgi:hypothetical protein
MVAEVRRGRAEYLECGGRGDGRDGRALRLENGRPAVINSLSKLSSTIYQKCVQFSKLLFSAYLRRSSYVHLPA